jgi:hypothetical protein
MLSRSGIIRQAGNRFNLVVVKIMAMEFKKMVCKQYPVALRISNVFSLGVLLDNSDPMTSGFRTLHMTYRSNVDSAATPVSFIQSRNIPCS